MTIDPNQDEDDLSLREVASLIGGIIKAPMTPNDVIGRLDTKQKAFSGAVYVGIITFLLSQGLLFLNIAAVRLGYPPFLMAVWFLATVFCIVLWRAVFLAIKQFRKLPNTYKLSKGDE